MPTDPIARLLQQGLDHYGRNEIVEAVRCWRKVLELAPDNLVARDYLDAAGAEVSLPASERRAGRDAEIIDFGVARANLAGEREGSSPSAVSDVLKQSFKAEVAQLLRDKRYESALELLYAAHERHPDDLEIGRSIELLRARLETRSLPPRASLGPAAPPARSSRLPTVRARDNAVPVRDSAVPAREKTVPAREKTVPAREKTVPARENSRPVRSHTPSARAITGVRPALDAGVGEEDYSQLFKRATEAYMIRDFELAIQLFEKCHEQRPDDRRPLYNLNALRRRMRGE